MKLIVGLGNPGAKYNRTRHNVGFDVVSCLAQRYDVGRPKSKFNGEIAETNIKNQKVILLSPLTFMNLSGQSVRAAVDFYKLPLTDLLIICDDITLDVARLRFRPKGSAGGQNGLKDIINRIGTQEFNRLRIGVGLKPPQWDAADFVLGKFSKPDQQEIDSGVVRAADAIEVWIEHGIQTAMNRFNADPKKEKLTKSPNASQHRPDDSSDETKTTIPENTE